MIGLVAAAVVRLRFWIVAAWAAALAAAFVYLPTLSQAQGSPLNLLALTTSKAVAVERASVDRFGFPVLTRTMVVQWNPHGLSWAAQERVVARAVDVSRHHPHDLAGLAFALPVINTFRLFPGSRESSTTAITYLYFQPGTSMSTQDETAHRYADRINQPGDALVGVTGALPAESHMGLLINDAIPLVSGATIALIILILAVAFRGVLAPLVTVASAGAAYLVGAHLISWLGMRQGTAVPVEMRPLLVVLIFAILTDYAVLYLTAMRRRMIVGDGRLAAVTAASNGVLPIVLTAGITVTGAAAALTLARLGLLHGLGPGLAIAVAIALLSAVTLIPSLLAIFGRSLFWPGLRLPARPVRQAVPQQWTGRPASAAAARRPLLRLLSLRPIAFTAAALIAAGLGFGWWQTIGMRLGLDVLRSMPSTSEVGRAADAAGRGFAPGVLAPTLVLVHQPGLASDRVPLVRLEAAIERQPGVAGVIGPREQPLLPPQGAVFSKSGADARYLVILDHSPYMAPAISAVDSLRQRLPGLLSRTGLHGATAGVGGDTAISAETIRLAGSDIIPVAIAIVLIELVVLAVFLRSVIAPLYLVFASVLALGAPLALTIAIFNQGLGLPDLAFLIPITAGVLLVALGSDYNIFVAGRVAQAAQQRPLWEALTVAMPLARKAIGVAALTLALSFATLAIVPLTSARELAAALCLGILIDSFVVRSYLVPALISLFGHIGRGHRIED